MNSFERIEAVKALETPDRVPVGPLLDHFAATYAGITNAELMTDGNKRISAVLKTMRELGPWDITFAADTSIATLLKLGIPAKMRQPGVDLDPNEIHQFQEVEFLTPDDYDRLKRMGVFRFMWSVTGRLYPEMKGLKAAWPLISTSLELRKHRKMIEKAGAKLACGFVTPGVLMEYFSFGRSMQPFIMDLFDRREKINEVNRLWTEGMTRIAIKGAKFVGEPTIFIGCSRTSPVFISPKLFEDLVLPEYEYAANMIMNAGMTPLFHCDTDWTKFLPYFKKFPPKKLILELDSHTDIRKAKEILGDRMCIMGDVPAALLAFGSKDEVMDYCKGLIKDVGKGGGFILSSGCSIPANAKPENVKALVEAAEEWGYY